MRINQEQESTIDWDWFAVDVTGSVGHFTSAGLRTLPATVKSDADAVARLARYFLTDLAPSSDFVVTAVAESKIPRPNDPEFRERFKTSFIAAASRGIFSYNTDMTRESDASYYLVAKPKKELKVDDLPREISSLLMRTKAPLRFVDAEQILGRDTSMW